MIARPSRFPQSEPAPSASARARDRLALILVLALAALGASGCAAVGSSGCAVVKPYEREKLSDPIMDPGSHLSKQTLEQKFFSTREGSVGGGAGMGGGCGCAK